ncbi:hypothetical protein HOC35_00470 [Candidatus Woesearchaeota archaeon]|jgi:hypothetical protein|nr:hypothetical protein [Candidatus Woesearchaeota archaeon]
MVKIELLLNEKKISRIKETELSRYLDFYKESYTDNLNHATANVNNFPRWSIVSGYYAMHDISKLFIAKVYRFKIDREVHATTIKVLKELLNDPGLLKLIEDGYGEYSNLDDDLKDAKKERVKVQYYTGTDFMKHKYANKAKEFVGINVKTYVEKILKLIEGSNV